MRPRDRRAPGGREEANRCVAPKIFRTYQPNVRLQTAAIDRRAASNDARHRQLGGVQLMKSLLSAVRSGFCHPLISELFCRNFGSTSASICASNPAPRKWTDDTTPR